MEKTVKKSTFTLPNRKVLVVPVRRKGKWLGTDHEANFLFKHSYFSVVVPRNQVTGAFIDPLTSEERTFLESSASGLALAPDALSIHNKEKNYWAEYRIKLDKHVLQLNLSDPVDYIRWKVLLSNRDYIAPSSDKRFAKGTYKYVITEEGYQNEERVKAASSKAEAYKSFGEMMSSSEKMQSFLNVYFTQKPTGKTIPPNASKDFLTAEIEKLIESDLAGYLKLNNDKHYKEKVLIYAALKARALKREGLTFKTPEDIIIGDSMDTVIGFILNPLNNEEVIKMKARIDNSFGTISPPSLTEILKEPKTVTKAKKGRPTGKK